MFLKPTWEAVMMMKTLGKLILMTKKNIPVLMRKPLTALGGRPLGLEIVMRWGLSPRAKRFLKEGLIGVEGWRIITRLKMSAILGGL